MGRALSTLIGSQTGVAIAIQFCLSKFPPASTGLFSRATSQGLACELRQFCEKLWAPRAASRGTAIPIFRALGDNKALGVREPVQSDRLAEGSRRKKRNNNLAG